MKHLFFFPAVETYCREHVALWHKILVLNTAFFCYCFLHKNGNIPVFCKVYPCASWLYLVPVPVVKLSCCGWGRGTLVGQGSQWHSWPLAVWAPPRKWRGRCLGDWCQRFFLHTSSHPLVESTWSFHPVGRNSNVVLILTCFIIPK